jgi:hypothetical protein
MDSPDSRVNPGIAAQMMQMIKMQGDLMIQQNDICKSLVNGPIQHHILGTSSDMVYQSQSPIQHGSEKDQAKLSDSRFGHSQPDTSRQYMDRSRSPLQRRPRKDLALLSGPPVGKGQPDRLQQYEQPDEEYPGEAEDVNHYYQHARRTLQRHIEERRSETSHSRSRRVSDSDEDQVRRIFVQHSHNEPEVNVNSKDDGQHSGEEWESGRTRRRRHRRRAQRANDAIAGGMATPDMNEKPHRQR